MLHKSCQIISQHLLGEHARWVYKLDGGMVALSTPVFHFPVELGSLNLTLFSQYFHFSPKTTKLFLLLSGQTFSFSSVDLTLVDPLTKSLGRDVQITGYLREGMLLVGGVN